MELVVGEDPQGRADGSAYGIVAHSSASKCIGDDRMSALRARGIEDALN